MSYAYEDEDDNYETFVNYDGGYETKVWMHCDPDSFETCLVFSANLVSTRPDDVEYVDPERLALLVQANLQAEVRRHALAEGRILPVGDAEKKAEALGWGWNLEIKP